MIDYTVLPKDSLTIKPCSLEEVYASWKEAQATWCLTCLEMFGYVPDSVLVDKATYMLLYVYSRTYGNFRNGNWLDLDMMVSYSDSLNSGVVLLGVDFEYFDFLAGGCLVMEKEEGYQGINDKGK